MCIYCEGIKHYKNKDFEVSPKYGRAYIIEDCEEFRVDFEIEDCVHCAGFKVNYCPICGRKLD